MMDRMPGRLLLAAALALLLAGCVSSLELHPRSATPQRWATDPRTRNLGPLRIVYSSLEPGDRVTATISSRAGGRGRFTARGHWWWEATPEVVARTPAAKLVQVYEF